VRLISGQDGMAAVDQLISLGLTRSQIRARVERDEWTRLARGVVGFTGLPMTWRRRCRLALLVAHPDAALGHASAGRLHGFDGYDREQRVILSFPGELRPRTLPAGVLGRISAALTPRECVVVDGLRCVMRPVALIQVAADDGPEAAGKALDSMLRRGDAPEWVRQTSSRWRRRGVVGPGVVMRLLDERVDGRLPRSWFQRLAKRTLAARGIRLVDEFVVRGPSGATLAELDLANPALKIGVECQSWRWHATPTARAADARRKRRLRALGWEIVEVWWSDLDDMDDIEAELRLVIDRRRPLLC
jgi:hypothetical protein